MRRQCGAEPEWCNAFDRLVLVVGLSQRGRVVGQQLAGRG